MSSTLTCLFSFDRQNGDCRRRFHTQSGDVTLSLATFRNSSTLYVKIGLDYVSGTVKLYSDSECEFLVKTLHLSGGLAGVETPFQLSRYGCLGVCLEVLTRPEVNAPPETAPTVVPSALEQYLNLLEEGDFSDVTFRVQGQDIPAHRSFLAARSPYFKAMFRSDMKENETGIVEVPDITAEGFEVILRHVYGDASLPEHRPSHVDGGADEVAEEVEDAAIDIAAAVLPKAHEYGLAKLVEECADRMTGTVSETNVCDYFLLSRLHDCEELSAQCVNFMRDNSERVQRTEGWTRLGQQAPQVALSLLAALLTVDRRSVSS